MSVGWGPDLREGRDLDRVEVKLSEIMSRWDTVVQRDPVVVVVVDPWPIFTFKRLVLGRDYVTLETCIPNR